MDETKLTPWFPASVLPVRPGVYERDIPYPDQFSFWTGTHWRWSDRTPETAARAGGPSATQNARWRGLAEKPE